MNTPLDRKHHILELLGSGVSESAVAAAVGCSPSYVSQLLADADFRNAVLERRVAALTANSARDAEYDKMEDALISRLNEVIPFMTRSAEIVRALNVVNAAKRRGAQADQPVSLESTKQVLITMPVQIINQLQMNANREVIAVEGKEMISASRQQVARAAAISEETPALEASKS